MTLLSEPHAVAVMTSLITASIAVWAPQSLLAALDLEASKGWQLGLWTGMLGAAGLAQALLNPLNPWLAAALSLLVIACVAVAFYDAAFLLIPNILTLGIALAALLFWRAGTATPSLWGAALCGGLLAAVAWAWHQAKGADGLGQGDIKLAAALGLVLGLEAGLWMVAAAASSGALWAMIMSRLNPEREVPLIPFGLFLALAGGGLTLARFL